MAIEHRRLRSAIEFAVAIADAGQRLRPPLASPAELKPFLRQPRVPSAALGRLRRAIEADDEFRRRLAAGALPELVDPIGIEWLRRDEGWENRVDELVELAEEDERRADGAAALRRAERRRDAAEQATVRTRAELVALRARLEELTRQVDGQRGTYDAAAAESKALHEQLADARRAERHAKDKAAAALARLTGVEAERDQARQQADAAAEQRDALLAERAERAGITVSARQVMELRTLAESARGLADRMSSLVEVGAPTRQPVALPGGVARDSRRATEHLLRISGSLVLIDGYNVAKLGWPELELAAQRTRGLDLIDDVARRFGSDVTVVFDGADVIGAHSASRRLARVVYSTAGVSADDVIRAEVRATPPQRPVIVVTNDQAVRRSVAAVGANLISSDAFLALARR